jgi:ABC-type multidrug transport system fused ATPase/permease subunit
MAYVSQTSWIENATVRDNIRFGLPCRAQLYKDVLNACDLHPDVALLAEGDNTEIGPEGFNLSGGRIALARALYSRAETLVIDDIFSAVDVNTARHLFRHALAKRAVRAS